MYLWWAADINKSIDHRYIHCNDVCGSTCEEIMGQHEDTDHENQRPDPRQAHSVKHLGQTFGQDLHSRRHKTSKRNQSGKPEKQKITLLEQKNLIKMN